MAAYQLPNHENTADIRKETVKFTLKQKHKIVKKWTTIYEGWKIPSLGK
jgi:hypothetical protein